LVEVDEYPPLPDYFNSMRFHERIGSMIPAYESGFVRISFLSFTRVLNRKDSQIICKLSSLILYLVLAINQVNNLIMGKAIRIVIIRLLCTILPSVKGNPKKNPKKK
jgi:hypothetical protein